jgi:hypothetical protein
LRIGRILGDGVHDPKDAIQDAPVVNADNATRLVFNA